MAEWRRSSHCESGNCVEVAWTKSSYCDSANSCVEVAWTKSTHSGADGCVEIAAGEAVLMRDSKIGEASPVLAFDLAAWRAFIEDVREDRLTRH